MKRSITLLTMFCTLMILAWGQVASLAQDSGPVVDILGKPVTDTDTPDIHAYVSVADPSTGHVLEGLSDDNFAVLVSEEEVEATSSPETTGIAVALVIDRGGIARRGDKRIGQAVDLAQGLLDMLNIDGSESADMAALIGIRGRDNGGLTPLVPFTDYDPNSLKNEFNALRTEVVNETTPLYDGIDQAIEWLTNNPDSDIQAKLAHRRPIIVVFSDGIDKNFSDEARRIDIIDQCTKNNILLYSIRMGSGTSDAYNMQIMAERTHGLYVTHTGADDTDATDLFENIVTQRQSYRVTFRLLRPQGDYRVHIQVLDTSIGDGADDADVSSRLQLPQIALTAPGDGVAYTVPYSQTTEAFEPQVVQLKAQVTPSDGLARDPEQVSYFANGVLIGTSTAAPDFAFTWDLSAVVTPTEKTQEQKYTLTAEAEDVYLGERMESTPITIRVKWEAKKYTIQELGIAWLTNYWWLLVILVVLLLGMLILLILLIRTRSEVARKAVTRATGVLKGVTRRLGPMSQKSPGKLVVIQGANMGKEFRLAAQVVKVGRDPQFCDFALYDEYASNPHFSVQLEQTQFYITDEGSTNGTRVNGTPISPHKRMLLQPDAIIEVGQTRLQFKRLGGTTRQLGAQVGPQAGATPPVGMPVTPPPAGPGQWGHPPTQPAPGAGQQSKPTRQVYD